MSSCAFSAVFFALAETQGLADVVARHAALTVAALEDHRFEGGEFKLRPLQSVRGRTAFVLQSLVETGAAPLSQRLLRLLFLLNSLRDAGATRRIALVPYLAFARQERRTHPRDSVNTRYVAQLLEASGADQLISLDVHDPAALDNAFRIPVDHLTALPMMVDHFAARLTAAQVAVVSPDIGGIKRAQIFSELLQSRLARPVTFAFIEKRRSGDSAFTGRLVGDIPDREVILLDDLCATGGTLTRAAEVCHRAGVRGVHVAVTHMCLDAGLQALLKSGAITSILTTDSVGFSFDPPRNLAVPDKLVTLSIAPLLGQAVRRMLAGKSVAPLLSRWPVAFDD